MTMGRTHHTASKVLECIISENIFFQFLKMINKNQVEFKRIVTGCTLILFGDIKTEKKGSMITMENLDIF